MNDIENEWKNEKMKKFPLNYMKNWKKKHEKKGRIPVNKIAWEIAKRTNKRKNAQTEVPQCSTGHCPLGDRCPKCFVRPLVRRSARGSHSNRKV